MRTSITDAIAAFKGLSGWQAAGQVARNHQARLMGRGLYGMGCREARQVLRVTPRRYAAVFKHFVNGSI